MDSKSFVNNGKSNQSYTTYQHIQTHAPHLMEVETTEDLHQSSQISIYTGADGALALHETQQKSQNKRLFTPTAQLTGHQSEVFCVKFSPCGNYLASAGFDQQVLLWDVYNECKNFAVLQEHSNAILELHWSTDGTKIYTASADKTVCAWDFQNQKIHRKLKSHNSFVNSCFPARRGLEMVVSGDDEGSAKVWDLRNKAPLHVYDYQCPITAVSFNDTSDIIFIGGLDNQIKALDLRKMDTDYFVLQGHTDTITGISLSHEGSYLLSNSMDNTIRCFDVRPYVLKSRCLKTYQGGKHSHEQNLLRVSWSADGDLITAGSADRVLYTWDTTSQKIVHKLGGHNGSINESVFNPKGDLIATASSDQTVVVGELPSYSL